ncbi:MAG: hypothetical protein ABUT39_16705 [Acidobacteriota bacterium]
MKRFAFAVVLVLVAFAVPVSAEEMSKAAPTTPLLQQIEGAAQPVERIPPLIPYCSAVQGTSCTTVGSKRSCTDVCHNQLSCTCTSAHYWSCMYEC